MKASSLVAASTPKKAAATLKSMGRRGDTELVHVNRKELAILEKITGSKARNPKTGLREFAEGDDTAAGTADAEAAALEGAMDFSPGAWGPGEDRSFAERALDYVNNNPLSVLGVGVPGLNSAVAAGRAIGQANERQIQDAYDQGRLSQEDFDAIQSGGYGTIKGGGLMGEDVTVGLGPGPIGGGYGGDRSDQNGADAGGNSSAGPGETATPPTETPPAASTNADRPRVITPGMAGAGTRDFVREALSRARRNLGGGDPVPTPLPGSPPIALSAGDSTMAKSKGIDRIRNLVAGSGRRGDTEAVHLSPALQRILQQLGGSGGTNPATGLKEFAPAPLNYGATMAGDGADGPMNEQGGGTNDEGNQGPIYVGPGGKTDYVEPDISAFNALADEAGRIGSNPRERQADLYGDIARRRDALLSSYNDDQLSRVAGQHYGGAGVYFGVGGNGGGIVRQMLMDRIAQGDRDFYRGLGSTPNDAVRPPITTPPPGGGAGGTVPPGGGGGGVIPEGQQRAFNVDASGRPVGQTGVVGGGTKPSEGIGTVTEWLNTNLPGMLRNLIPQQAGQVAAPGNLNAISASTNLVRTPVASRRFRSRRYRSQVI